MTKQATASNGATAGGLAGLEHSLRMEPGPGNTRNSEGDFIRLRDGRWMLVYTHFLTGSGGDHDRAHLAARFSEDDGRTWTDRDAVVVPNEGGFNVMSVTLRRLPGTGEIGLFYLRKNSLSDCRPVLRRSSDEGRTWSRPTEIVPEEQKGYYVVNNDRVVILPGGRLVVPASLHQNPEGAFNPVGRVMCYLSDDGGKTWRRNKMVLSLPVTGSRTGLQEPGVVELKDGRLLLWARTDQGTQWQSYSSDGGETWTDPRPGPLRSPAAPASIKRIPSTGDLVAIWDDNYDPKAGWHVGARTPLAVAVSVDEGRTWTRRQILEGDPGGWYCYTAIAFTEEKNRDRQQVLLAYCAGKGAADGLKSLQVARLPVRALYAAAGRR